MQSIVNADDTIEYGSSISSRGIINTPYGLFYIAQNGKKIFKYSGSLIDISQQGLKAWFNENLGSKLLQQYPDYPLYDNPVAGIGCQAIYDSIYDMVYFTKKDYVALKDNLLFDDENGIPYYYCDPIPDKLCHKKRVNTFNIGELSESGISISWDNRTFDSDEELPSIYTFTLEVLENNKFVTIFSTTTQYPSNDIFIPLLLSYNSNNYILDNNSIYRISVITKYTCGTISSGYCTGTFDYIRDHNESNTCNTCPDGFTISGNQCIKITETDPIIDCGTKLFVFKGEEETVYCKNGLRLYDDITNYAKPLKAETVSSPPYTYDLKDANGTLVNILIPTLKSMLWGSSTSSTCIDYNSINGRLNKSGIWAYNYPTNTELSYEFCINLFEEKQYLIGMAADNIVKFYIDNGNGYELYVHLDTTIDGASTDYKLGTTPFVYWHVFPITLPSGYHKIKLVGINLPTLSGYYTIGTFAAEIYNISLTQFQNILTDPLTSTSCGNVESDLDPYIIFSTKSYRSLDLAWTRSSNTITFHNINHGLNVGDTIYVKQINSIVSGNYTITNADNDNFSITYTYQGPLSGVDNVSMKFVWDPNNQPVITCDDGTEISYCSGDLKCTSIEYADFLPCEEEGWDTNPTDPCTECPEGYTDIDGVCTKTTITDPVYTGSFVTVDHGNYSSAYCSHGLRLYQDISNMVYPIAPVDNTANWSSYEFRDNNGTGVSVSPITGYSSVESTLWGSHTGGCNISNYGGRLNTVGIWSSQIPVTAINTEISFDFCIDLDNTKQYLIGMAGDNICKLYIDNILYINMDAGYLNTTQFPFVYWHVFPVTLLQGNHTLRLVGKNLGAVASFGAEIYDIDLTKFKSLLTNPVNQNGCGNIPTDLDPYIIFSTKDQIGKQIPDPTKPGEWKCDNGATLNCCTGECKCVKIETSRYLPCPPPPKCYCEYTDPLCFKECSWTVSYDPNANEGKGGFVSFHDWIPNLLIPSNDHFYSIHGDSIWKHNSTYDSLHQTM